MGWGEKVRVSITLTPPPPPCCFEMLKIPGPGVSGVKLGLVKQILGYFTISI